MSHQIDIHPVSDSELSDEEEFRSIQGTPTSDAASVQRQASETSGSTALYADAQPEQLSTSYPTRSRSELATEALSDPSEYDDSLTFKDLDTGRELHFQQRNTIRDIDTGQVYVLDTEADVLDLPENSKGYTDVISGNKLSADEFDRLLGLAGALGTARRRRLEGLSARSESGDGSSASDFVTPNSRQSPKVKGNKAKSWLKKRSNVLFQRTRFSKDAKRGSQDGVQPQAAPAAEGADSDDDASSQGASTAPSTPADRSGSFSSDVAAGAPVQVGVPVKVHVRKKLHRDLADLCLVQELHAHTGVMWTMKFSKNGHYLASAGQDGVIRIWQITIPRGGPPPTPAAGDAANGHASIPAGNDDFLQHSQSGWSRHEEESPHAQTDRALLKAEPIRSYRGHKQDVLDVAWSKSQFLLSASMDKTVRLWHISMDDCLRVFRHTDFVTSLDFHPIDDKFFLSGSIDGKVRVWNIPEQRVIDWADVHEMVTAVAWDERGERLVVGSMKGKCRFYTCAPRTHALEYTAQIDVKNRRGKAAKGRKITGMQFAPGEPDSLLITSNDSRIRLYDGYTLRCKYKGNSNRNTQIRATFSQGGGFVICGSDDGWVYVWSLAASSNKEKSTSHECFHAHDDIVTVAVFAPETSWLPVSQSPSTPDKSKASGVSEGLGRLGLRSKLSKEESAHASAAASTAMGSSGSTGAVILTAGYAGEIKIFEAQSAPQLV